jgi:hypothetical protein
MRPIFWQLVAVLVVIAVIAIVRLNKKVDALEAELKQAKTPPLVPKANPTVSNGGFQPVQPST